MSGGRAAVKDNNNLVSNDGSVEETYNGLICWHTRKFRIFPVIYGHGPLVDGTVAF
jgi:hypothetical protein